MKAGERQMYAEFASDFPFCWACEIKPLPPIFYTSANWRWLTQQLDSHHIIGGAGRKHERFCLARLCRIHHGTIHNDRFRPTKDTPILEPLTLGNLMWLKRYFDSKHVEVKKIMELRTKKFEVIRFEPLEVEG